MEKINIRSTIRYDIDIEMSIHRLVLSMYRHFDIGLLKHHYLVLVCAINTHCFFCGRCPANPEASGVLFFYTFYSLMFYKNESLCMASLA